MNDQFNLTAEAALIVLLLLFPLLSSDKWILIHSGVLLMLVRSHHRHEPCGLSLWHDTRKIAVGLYECLEPSSPPFLLWLFVFLHSNRFDRRPYLRHECKQGDELRVELFARRRRHRRGRSRTITSGGNTGGKERI